MKVEAVVLAGATNRGKLSEVSDVPHEALIPIAGRPMVHYVLEALKASDSVQRIIVVGPEEALKTAGLPDGVEVTPAGESMVENLRLGLAKVSNNGPSLIVTCD